MKQKFNKKIHEKFINYFWIKKYPTKIETNFYSKTIKYIKYIKWIPWLKMIWIWNSISMNCASNKSDIDLFIVTSNNSMWINRIIITFLFKILNVRKTAKKHAWRFCLSFFATQKWLDFSKWKIDNDIYLYFWIIYFKPILNYDNTYELFIKKNSNWANFSEYENIIKENKKYIKYRNIIIKSTKDIKKWSVFFNYKEKFLNKVLKLINYLFKMIFLQKTLKHYNSIWKPYWVIINNNLLKFHNWDIRENIKKELI